MNRISILITGLGLVLFLGSLPLAFRKVPRNSVYGFRTAISMASDQAWYAINAQAGRWLAWGALVIIAIGGYGWFMPESFRAAYSRYAFFVAISVLLIVVISVALWSRRYSP